jgi:hypothetical protein
LQRLAHSPSQYFQFQKLLHRYSVCSRLLKWRQIAARAGKMLQPEFYLGLLSGK